MDTESTKSGMWTGIVVGIVCMGIADLIMMIPAIHAFASFPSFVTRWIIFAILVSIAWFVGRKMVRR